ncbi:E3 ubiquitin-protein ligase SGR9, amyloplastic-like, partial [Carica papaya]
MAALSTLNPTQLRVLTHSILNLSCHHLHRLSSILSSPSLFSLTIHHLISLSPSSKSLLIARHLLSLLRLLLLHFHPQDRPHLSSGPPAIKLRDLDAVLLLLFICETHHHHPQTLLAGDPSEWRESLSKTFSHAMLSNLSEIGGYNGGVLITYAETVSRCLRFVRMVDSCSGGRMERKEAAASPATVVGLPTVE